MTITRRLTAIAAVIVLVALVLAGFIAVRHYGTPQGSKGPALGLVVAEAGQPTFALLYVADAQGYFKDEGLDVSFNSFLLGRDAIANALEGKADLATVYETPTVTKIYEGHDLAILSTLHTSTRGHAIIARRDRGVVKPADLRGKRVGVTKGITTDYFLTVFLATEGIGAGSIREVNLEPGQYERALLTGAVDALATFNPYLLSLQAKLGKENAAVFYSDVYVETSMLVGRREVVEGKKEAMSRVVRAIVRAQDFIERNPQQGMNIVTRRLAEKYPESAIRDGWNTFRAEAKLDNVLLTLLVQEGHWLRESGRFSTPPPDFARAIVPYYLQSAKPSAVTVLSPPPRP